MSQAQAARELDVSTDRVPALGAGGSATRPGPLAAVAGWLGVSVTTLLLSERKVTLEEAHESTEVEQDYARSGRDWDTVGATKPGDFFTQARELIREAVSAGDLTREQVGVIEALVERISNESPTRRPSPGRKPSCTRSWRQMSSLRSTRATPFRWRRPGSPPSGSTPPGSSPASL